MKICILADSHDHIPRLGAAAEEARDLGAKAIVHCGDVVAPSTLGVLQPLGLPVHVIHGNNTGDLYALGRIATRRGSVLHYHGQDAGIELAGRRIFIVHFPHYARAMAATGDWDLVCCGHTHRPLVEYQANLHGGKTPVVNPGSVAGVGSEPTYLMADLETLRFEIRPVPALAAA